MVTDIIQAALCSVDGAEFNDLAACPCCGGPVQGYDTRQKRYAVIRDGGNDRTLTVRVKRFTCRTCHTLCNAEEPFYPDTRLGSLVVDLYFTFATTMPESRAGRLIDAMGIRVDRTTWRNYTRHMVPAIPVTEIFGMRIPSSVLTLSSLAARAPEGEPISGADVLAACGFPSRHRAPAPEKAPTGKMQDSLEEPEREAPAAGPSTQLRQMSRQAPRDLMDRRG
jgi:hypothetical protein